MRACRRLSMVCYATDGMEGSECREKERAYRILDEEMAWHCSDTPLNSAAARQGTMMSFISALHRHRDRPPNRGSAVG